MDPRDQILKMQRIILKQLKEDVLRLHGPESEELSRYQASYQREFNFPMKVSSKNQLVEEIKKAHIVWGADFHPFSQSQRTHLRLLRELVKGKRPIILALEAISSKYQKHIDDYMAGLISDSEFLAKTNYHKEWGFPWENYRVFFDFAKSYGLGVRGINQIQKTGARNDLRQRDLFAARAITQLRIQHPDKIIYVLYGDLHLASSRLPRMTKSLLKKRLKTKSVTVFQNSEKVYWRLARRKLEEKVDVIKLKNDSYCVVNSPPWMKWQAYLQFLEKNFSFESADPVDEIKKYNKILLQVLELNEKDYKFDDYHVFEKGDVKFVQQISRITTTKEKKFIEKYIRSETSFFIPRLNVFYLSKSDVNHVVSLTGQYLHSKMRREQKITYEFPQDFSCLVWVEAIGFFMSKLINNRRKHNRLKRTQPHRAVTLIVLEQQLKEKMAMQTNEKTVGRLRRYRSRKFIHYLKAARILGAEIGNKIYDGFVQSEIDHPRLRSWIRVKTLGNKEFHAFYLNVLKTLSRLNLKQVKPEERL